MLKGKVVNCEDALVVLRLGRLADLSTSQVIKCFQQIARDHGSSAHWIQEQGLLIVADPAELDRNFPYYDWVLQAFLESAE